MYGMVLLTTTMIPTQPTPAEKRFENGPCDGTYGSYKVYVSDDHKLLVINNGFYIGVGTLGDDGIYFLNWHCNQAVLLARSVRG